MKKVLSRILYLFFILNHILLKFKYRKNIYRSYNNKGSKKFISDSEQVIFKAETDKKINDAEKNIIDIVNECAKNPEKLLNYVKASGTSVFVIPYAKKLLSIIEEEQGFISELKGMRAFYVNLITAGSYSFKTSPLFIFENETPDFYETVYQFYKWYCSKSDIVGFEYSAQRNLKHFLRNPNSNALLNLSIKDNLELQEAVNREKDAADFVTKLIQQNEGAQNVKQRMSDGGAEV